MNIRPAYDTEEFRRLWWQTSVPLRTIAEHYGVSIPSVWRAARRRGFPHRATIQ